VVGASGEAAADDSEDGALDEPSPEVFSSDVPDAVVSSGAEELLALLLAVCVAADEAEDALCRPGSVPALTRAAMSAATTAKTATLPPAMLRHEGRRAGRGVRGGLMADDDGGDASRTPGQMLGGA
jgi:hypothetical protein